jgi:hypothetical protein
MQSSDPTFQRLFELWTPKTADQKWRVRFNDGTITVFTKMLAHEDEAGKRHGLGTVVREMREAAPDRWQVNDETYFELSEVKDVTHLESGDVVFPASAIRKRIPFSAPSLGISGVPASKIQAGVGAAVVVGLIALAIGVSDAITWVARKRWPSTFAVVQSVEAHEVVYRSRGSLRSGGYTPLVVYRFALAGANHVGSRLSGNDDRFDTESEALRSVSYRRGDTIKAYYNPKNPDDSILQPNTVLPGNAWLLAAACVCFFGAFLAWHGNRPPKLTPEP